MPLLLKPAPQLNLMLMLQVSRGLSPGPAASPDAVTVSIAWRSAALDGASNAWLPITLLLLLPLSLTPKLLLFLEGHLESSSLGAAPLAAMSQLPLLP